MSKKAAPSVVLCGQRNVNYVYGICLYRLNITNRSIASTESPAVNLMLSYITYPKLTTAIATTRIKAARMIDLVLEGGHLRHRQHGRKRR
eukprot:6172752-Pleurochrysis_carterae.AAC.1